MVKQTPLVSVATLAVAGSLLAGSGQVTEWFGPQVERTWIFVESVYSKDLSRNPSRITVEMAGQGGALVPRTVTFSFSRPTACESQREDDTASVSFYYHGEKLVGLGASGKLIRAATTVDPVVREKRKAAAIQALQVLFGWAAPVASRLSVDQTKEFVTFPSAGSQELPLGATTASFDPVSGMLLSAGMI